MAQNIIFIKTHKCASTTIQKYLLEYGKINNLKILSPYKWGMNDTKYSDQPIRYKIYTSIFGPFNININHSPYEPILHRLIPNAICITSVREPLSRAISHYYSFLHKSANIPYSRTFECDFNDYYLKYFLDREKVDVDGVKLGLNNYMSRWLGYDCSREVSEADLRSRFSFIGIKEDMNRTQALLKDLLDIKIDLPVSLENDNSDYRSFEVSDEVRERFVSQNLIDYSLYRAARNIFSTYESRHLSDIQ